VADQKAYCHEKRRNDSWHHQLSPAEQGPESTI
jgi:hypothetical protein